MGEIASEPVPSSTVGFTFEGRELRAPAGRSLAAALHDNGVRVLGRSVKYHRPRGYQCGFNACGSCLLTVDGSPGTPACGVRLVGGERVQRESGWPTARLDMLRAADLLRPFLGAGFQFRLFPRNPRLSALAGRLMGRLAGGGRMPDEISQRRSRISGVVTSSPCVAVVGGGVSGLVAALAAARAGVSTTIIDVDFAGARARCRTEPLLVTGEDGRERTADAGNLHARLLEEARGSDRIRVLVGTVVGFVDGLLIVVGDGIRHEMRPGALIIATGGYEVPARLAGHDLPGVMLGDAAIRLAEIEGVSPGRRAAVIADDPRSVDVAERLRRAGVEVVAEVALSSVDRIVGRSRATGIRIKSARGGSRRIGADLICVVRRRRPAEELVLQAAYAAAGSHESVTADDDPGAWLVDSRTLVVGTAAGSARYSLQRIDEEVTALASTLSSPDASDGDDHESSP